MNAHRIVFLDIDGVLNSCGSAWRAGNRESFLPSACAALARLLDASDAKIVITSSWREDVADRIPFAFQANGLSCYINRIIGHTPMIPEAPDATRRADEIDVWLAQHAGQVCSWVILDDDPAAELAGHFIQVDPDKGLTAQDASTALLWLRRHLQSL
jgi:hypothetical protein